MARAEIDIPAAAYREAVRAIVTVACNCAALAVAAWLIGPIGYGGRWQTLVAAGVILGVVNVLVRPLVVLLALPAVVLSLGLALLLVNALMLFLTSRIVTGLHLGGFWPTVGGALVIWLVNMALAPWAAGARRLARPH
jgi:putative membrane protein